MEQFALATSDLIKWFIARTLRLLSVYPIGLLILVLIQLMVYDSPWAADLAKLMSVCGLELWLLLPIGMLLATAVVVLFRCILNMVSNKLEATQVQFWTASAALVALVGLQYLYIDALWLHFDVDNAENIGFISNILLHLIQMVSLLSVFVGCILLGALGIGVLSCGYSGVYSSLKRNCKPAVILMGDPDLDDGLSG